MSSKGFLAFEKGLRKRKGKWYLDGDDFPGNDLITDSAPQGSEYQKLSGDSEFYVKYLPGTGSGVWTKIITDQDISKLNEIVLDPTGFVDISKSQLEFFDISRTFRISPVLSEFTFMIYGKTFTKNSFEEIILPNSESLFRIYYDDSGNLQYSLNKLPIDGTLLTIASIYWDKDNQKQIYFSENRHGLSMSHSTRKYIDSVLGSNVVDGFSLSYDISGNGSTDSELQVDIENGILQDSNLQYEINSAIIPSLNHEQILSPIFNSYIYYKSGSGRIRRNALTNSYPLKLGTNRLVYNYFDGFSWILSDVPNDNYCVYWIIGTNNLLNPLFTIVGQGISDDIETVSEANLLSNLDVSPLPLKTKFKVLYKLLFHVNDNYTNTFKAKLEYVIDLRFEKDIHTKLVLNKSTLIFSDKHYNYIQSSLSSVWNINHGLNKIPSVFILDNNGNEVFSEIEIIDKNNIKLAFSPGISGTAYLN